LLTDDESVDLLEHLHLHVAPQQTAPSRSRLCLEYGSA
jgi:hypothetical protein